MFLNITSHSPAYSTKVSDIFLTKYVQDAVATFILVRITEVAVPIKQVFFCFANLRCKEGKRNQKSIQVQQ